MKIATFNVNGVNGRLAVLLRWLNETAPDVVCLQELKSETFPIRAVREAGYEAIWQGEKSWNGGRHSRAWAPADRNKAGSPRR
jgi:exodeoxyribonuclease-3